MADRLTRAIKEIFQIPDSYEERKLLKLVEEAKNVKDARLYRILDCSAYCVEEFCYFCSGGKPSAKN